MSSDKENNYFCDGLTEEIINALAKINGLKVTSRTSSFFFKNKNISITKIGKDLNVSSILEGSVRLYKDTIRITAQLIEVKDDFHFWSESWNRKFENIFAVQDEISLLIADKIRENFGHFEIEDKLVSVQTDYIEAYRLYLKGNYHFQKWNLKDIELAKGYYSKALKLDPNHAQSHSGLAQYYAFMAGLGFMPRDAAYKKGEVHGKRSLELNPLLPEAYYVLGMYAFWYEWNFKKAIKRLNQALEINPNYARAYLLLGYIYNSERMFEKTSKNIERAISLDPLSSEVNLAKGYMYYTNEDYDLAIECFDVSIELGPSNFLAIKMKACCWAKQDRSNLIIDYFTSELPKTIDVVTKYGLLGVAYAIEKNDVKTEEYLKLLSSKIEKQHKENAQFFIFLIRILSNQKEKALNWLRGIIHTKPTLMLIMFSDPLLNSIKDDEDYKEIIKDVFSSAFNVKEKIRIKKELIAKKLRDTNSQKLLNYIKEEEPYLDSNLTLRSLASSVDIHPNQLSWLINHEFNKKFNEFINHYRVETFKRISKDPKNSHITLIGLAFESGFNSKTVFNTFFKKETGMTPMQYLKL